MFTERSLKRKSGRPYDTVRVSLHWPAVDNRGVIVIVNFEPCAICGHPRDEHTMSFCWHQGCEERHAFMPTVDNAPDG